MTKLLVVDEHHYYRDDQNQVWIPSQNDSTFWDRYLEVFDSIKVVARIKKVSQRPKGMILSSKDGVEFYDILDYTGPYEYAKNILKIRKQLKDVYSDCSHAIFRIPSELSFNIFKGYYKSNKPFAVEVLIDPWDALSPKVTRSIVRPYVRLRWFHWTKKLCKLANGTAYVTKYALQKRYPPRMNYFKNSTNSFTTNYSSLDINEDYYYNRNIIEKDVYKIVHVGSMQNYIKGQDILIRALAKVKEANIKFQMYFIGDGKIRNVFEEYVEKYNLRKETVFTGLLPGSSAVRDYLLDADLFVYPTKAEGLPRVLLEAMACSLPILATPVNGIPELLPNEVLINPLDYTSFANKIINVLDNKELRNKMSKDNYIKSLEYEHSILQARRKDFYQKLKTLGEIRK